MMKFGKGDRKRLWKDLQNWFKQLFQKSTGKGSWKGFRKNSSKKLNGLIAVILLLFVCLMVYGQLPNLKHAVTAVAPSGSTEETAGEASSEETAPAGDENSQEKMTMSAGEGESSENSAEKESPQIDQKTGEEADKETAAKESKETAAKESKEMAAKESKEAAAKESKETAAKERKEAAVKESKEAAVRESSREAKKEKESSAQSDSGKGSRETEKGREATKGQETEKSRETAKSQEGTKSQSGVKETSKAAEKSGEGSGQKSAKETSASRESSAGSGQKSTGQSGQSSQKTGESAGQNNSAEASGSAKLQPGDMAGLKAGTVVSQTDIAKNGAQSYFYIYYLDDAVFNRIYGKSYKEDCPMQKDDLRYVKVLHYGADGKVYVGEMISHKDISICLAKIFWELYNNKYPIEKMRLVDDYNADDLDSAGDDNSSSFNYRQTSGAGTGMSKHASGLAVDINPVYNPYVWYDENGQVHCEPENGAAYMDRDKKSPYKIEKDDLCYQLFISHGFSWGGEWGNEKDYMHFYIK